MKLDKKSMLLYAVTDRTWINGKSLEREVEKICKSGATFIQLREKDITDEEFIAEARKIKSVTDKYKIPFVINDNIEVANAVNADGVHIGQSDMEAKKARDILGKDKIIGISAGNLDEALAAEKNGADYIGVGAMFHTDTKQDATSVTFEEIKEITQRVHIPVVAIGGINKSNVLKLTGSGVDGIAVISAIFAENNVEEATKNMLKLAQKMVEK
ncbi:MAG: thiamine phosphate synthase [Anaerotignaceae bacterium]